MVKLAIAAVVATMLVRFSWFRRILLTEKRDWPERLVFTACLGSAPDRRRHGSPAAQLRRRGSDARRRISAGMIAGPYAGALVGALVGDPALIAASSSPCRSLIGSASPGAACARSVRSRRSGILTALLHRILGALLEHGAPAADRLARDPAGAPIGLEVLRQALGYRFGANRLFYLPGDERVALDSLGAAATVLSVAIPIKIWNNARIEHRLQEQEQLLMAARIEALASQINPHFLFNTLASISSLIRSQPETARTLIVKLSGLLRRLLRSHDHFVTLREELEAIDEYLDIESARFGPTPGVQKDVSADSLDLVVPSMILQPLVENSIKHGLHSQGGRRAYHYSIGPRQRARRHRGHRQRPGHRSRPDRRRFGGGIGLNNVNERLKVIYGANYRLQLSSVPGQGTCAQSRSPSWSCRSA